MLLLQPNPKIWMAIEQRRMIRLVYHNKVRIVEPHDYGILNGSVQLLAYQIGGSCSRPLPNWLLIKTAEIDEIQLLDQALSGRAANAVRQACQMGQALHQSEARQ
jgi:hypothetical protein